ncbi:MAG: ROK family protein [Candidatus Diapherotrites archaeon]|nr:ROK family protein [Candidatus Diapherotrites archaeon]
MAKAIGVDVGGTKMLFLLLDHQGKILERKKLATPTDKKPFLKTLVDGINDIKGNEKIEGIGLDFAGFIDSSTGIIQFSPNMPWINGVNINSYLKKSFNEELFFENDANAFALAEYAVGYKRKYKNIIGITLGTGVGSGIICNGFLVKGQGLGAELGHMIIDHSSGKICGCGNIGCFEAHCNGKALFEKAMEKGLKIKSNEELHYYLKRDDIRAIEAVKDVSKHLAVGFVNIINIFDPDAIIVGGGLSEIGLLLDTAKKELSKYKLVRNDTKILRAKLGEDAPAIGAAMLVFENRREQKK